MPQTSMKAVASLVLGGASLIVSLPAAIVAIVFGHLAKSEIRRSQGRLTGNGMAVAGLVLGYVGAVLLPLVLIVAAIAIPNLLRSRMAANEAAALGSIRALNVACVAYADTYGGFPATLSDLGPGGPLSADAAGLIDSALASGIKSGYGFECRPGETDAGGLVIAYEIHARPVQTGTTGRRFFFSDQSGVIRFSTDGPADANSPPIS